MINLVYKWTTHKADFFLGGSIEDSTLLIVKFAFIGSVVTADKMHF